MTFFDWNTDKGTARVSSYLWIYVLVTVIFTGVTIGLWYFFVVYRRPISMAVDEESPALYKEKIPDDCREKGRRTISVMAHLKSLLCR
jgi:hypothetical protein